MINYKIISFALGTVLLVATTAATSVYFARDTRQPEKVVIKNAPPPAQKVVRKCDDGNIAGKAVGGIGGGVVGSLVGGGVGKTAATIGGTLGGAYLGGKTIPLQNSTCK
jgi:outer membrane lipoprotein SlyB